MVHVYNVSVLDAPPIFVDEKPPNDNWGAHVPSYGNGGSEDHRPLRIGGVGGRNVAAVALDCGELPWKSTGFLWTDGPSKSPGLPGRLIILPPKLLLLHTEGRSTTIPTSVATTGLAVGIFLGGPLGLLAFLIPNRRLMLRMLRITSVTMGIVKPLWYAPYITNGNDTASRYGKAPYQWCYHGKRAS